MIGFPFRLITDPSLYSLAYVWISKSSLKSGYINWLKPLTYDSSQCCNYLDIVFVAVDSCCSLFNYSLEIIRISFSTMMCFYHQVFDWNCILFLNPQYRIILFHQPVMRCQFVIFKNFISLRTLKNSGHLQELIFSSYLSFKWYHVGCWPYYFY